MLCPPRGGGGDESNIPLLTATRSTRPLTVPCIPPYPMTSSWFQNRGEKIYIAEVMWIALKHKGGTIVKKRCTSRTTLLFQKEVQYSGNMSWVILIHTYAPYFGNLSISTIEVVCTFFRFNSSSPQKKKF